MLAGDGVADGNLARAVQALDAASGQGLAPALARAEGLFSAASAADREMWQSFVAWCRRILGRRLGERLPALVDDEETTMLAEALRERDEMKIDDGRRAGHEEGQRVLLSSLASQRFGTAAGAELEAVLAGVEDASELARVGALIIDCDSSQDFLVRARRR